MRTIGLISGMSWESTQTYYKLINEGVNDRLGGLHSAKILLYSVDFAEIERYQQTGDWQRAAQILANAAVNLEKAGADFILLCTNTMHKVAETIAAAVKIPFIHIADTAVSRLKEKGIDKVGLLGTRYTLTEDFYIKRLREGGIEVLIPAAEEIEAINSIIFGELCKGVVKEESRQKYRDVIENLKRRGACGIILGCTEIGMLIDQGACDLPVFDTTVIHAQAAIELALG